MVATLGGLGAVTAGLIGDMLPGRTAFIIAGINGLTLLLYYCYRIRMDVI